MKKRTNIVGIVDLIHDTGSIGFVVVQTDTGDVQCSINRYVVGYTQYDNIFKTWKVGDAVAIHGIMMKVGTDDVLVSLQISNSPSSNQQSDSDRYDRAMGILG